MKKFTGHLQFLFVGILFLISFVSLNAQQFPISVNTILSTPALPYLEDFISENPTAVMTTVSLNDASTTEFDVGLRLTITGQGVTLTSDPNYFGDIFTLSMGSPLVLTGYELADYFNVDNLIFSGISKEQYLNQGRLPEGFYSICFEAYDINNPFGLAVSNKGCGVGVIEQYDPPVLLSLLGESPFIPSQNYLFSWQAMHPGAFTVEYYLDIWEKVDGLSEADLMASETPYAQVQVTNFSSYVYSLVDPLLEPQREYLMRVQVVDPSGQYLFKNNGYSAPEWFSLSDDCVAGEPCDDEDGCTENDVYDGYCQCAGTLIPDCDDETPPCALGSPPVVQLPTEVEDSRFMANWSGEVGCYDYLVVEWSRDEDFVEGYETVIVDDVANIAYAVEAVDLASGDYYYRVSGFIGDEQGEFSENMLVSLNRCRAMSLDEMEYACGVLDSVIISQSELLTSLDVGAKIYAADWLVEITKVSGSGTFSGEAKVTNDLLPQAQLNLVFSNIKVNEDCQMVDGFMEVEGFGLALISPEISALLDELIAGIDLALDALDVYESIVGAIDSVLNTTEGINDYFVDDVSLLNGTTDFTDEYPYLDPALVDSLQEALDCFTNLPVDFDACMTGLIDVLSDIQDALEEMHNGTYQVNFLAEAEDFMGYDEFIYPELQEYYDEINIAGTPYRIPWVMVPSEGLQKRKLRAKKMSGGALGDETRIENNLPPAEVLEKTTVAGEDTEVTIELGGNEHEDVHPLYAYELMGDSLKIAGKANVVSYDPLPMTVQIVKVQDAIVPEIDWEGALDSIFGQANVDVTVLGVTNISVANPILQDNSGTGTFTNYTNEMKDIIDLIQDKQDDVNYIVMMKGNVDATKLGYMPRGRNVGFVYTENVLGQDAGLIKTVAHELGHGAYKLRHMKDVIEGWDRNDTDLLMEGGQDGTHLTHFEWERIHNPEGDWGLFDEDGEGEHVRLINLFSRFEIGLNSDSTFAFVTPTGGFIKLPYEVRNVVTAFGFFEETTYEYFNDFIKMVPGTLVSFTISDLTYTCRRTDGNKILGYFNGEDKYDCKDFGIDETLVPAHTIFTTVDDNSYNILEFSTIGLKMVEDGDDFLDVASFPLEFDAITNEKKLSLSENPGILGTNQYSLNKESLEWAFGANYQPDENWLKRIKIAELKQAFPLYLKYTTKHYDSWAECEISLFKSSSQTFDYDYAKNNCSCNYQTGGCDKPVESNLDTILALSDYYDYLISNGAKDLLERYMLLKVWDQDNSLIADIEHFNVINRQLHFASKADIKALKKETVVLLLSRLMKYFAVLESTQDYLDGELAILKLLQEFDRSHSDYVVNALENENVYMPGKFLYKQLLNKIQDGFLFWGEDNRKELVIQFVNIGTSAQETYSSRITEWMIDTTGRQFIVGTQSFMKRLFLANFFPAISYVVIYDPDEPLPYLEFYSIETDYDKETGRFSAEQLIKFGLSSGDQVFKVDSLRPFDLILLENKTRNNLIRGVSQVVSKDVPVPAIVLFYADEVLNNKTTIDAIFSAVDIVSIVASGGSLAAVSGARKAFLVVDMAADALSITANLAEDITNPKLQMALSSASMVLSVVSLSNSVKNAAGKIFRGKQAVDAVANLPLPNSLDLADEIKALNGSDLLEIVSDNFVSTTIAVYMRKALDSEGMTNAGRIKLQEALARMGAMRHAERHFIQIRIILTNADIPFARADLIARKMADLLKAKGIEDLDLDNFFQFVRQSEINGKFDEIIPFLDELDAVALGKLVGDLNKAPVGFLNKIAEGVGMVRAWKTVDHLGDGVRLNTSALSKIDELLTSGKIPVEKLEAALKSHLGDVLNAANDVNVGKILDRLKLQHVDEIHFDNIVQRLDNYPTLKQDLISNPDWFDTFDDILDNPEKYWDILGEGNVPAGAPLAKWGQGFWWKNLRELADDFEKLAALDKIEDLFGAVYGTNITLKVTNKATGEVVEIIPDFLAFKNGKYHLADAKYTTKSSFSVETAVTPNQGTVFEWIKDPDLDIVVEVRAANSKLTGFGGTLKQGDKISKSTLKIDILKSKQHDNSIVETVINYH